MTKKFLSIFKYMTLVSVVFFFVAISGCDDDDGPVVFSGTIMELITSDQFKQSTTVAEDKALDSLIKLLNQNPDLVALLGTSDKTLFAPSNKAFKQLLSTPGFPANIALISPSLIKGVLAYHIVNDDLKKVDLVPTGTGAGISTNYSDTNPCTGAVTVQVIKVNDDAGKTLLTGSTTAAIVIDHPDNLTTSGTVHITAAVLIPPSVGSALQPILGTLTATVLLGKDFSHLAKAATKADCAHLGTGGTTPILIGGLAAYLSKTGPYTAFLPPNAVFEGTAAALSITVDQFIANFTAAQWRNILLNHLVSGNNGFSTFTQQAMFTTLLSTNAKLTSTVTGSPCVPTATNPLCVIFGTSGGTTGLGGTIQAPIFVKDIPASNGVAHVVGKILIPN